MASSLLADTPWRAFGPDMPGTRFRSMITDDESRYLYWLARERYTGAGAIIDSGPLLGRSTVAMAEGLRLNQQATDDRKTGCIHSYDLFVYEPYMAQLFEGEPAPARGASLLPWFLEEIAPWRSLIEVHPGDVQRHPWTGGPIEILFIDLAKSWSLQAYLLREFFPHLIPGVSIVVQQDYFFHGCPWIHLLMEHLADYFTPVHMPDGPTLGFALERPIPPELLRLDYARHFSPDETRALMDRATARFPGAKRLVAMTASANLLLMNGDVEGAATLLETIRRSPDYDASVEFDFGQLARRVVPLLTAAPAKRDTPAPVAEAGSRTTTSDEDAQFLRDLLQELQPEAVIAIQDEPDRWTNALLDALRPVAADSSDDRVRLHVFAPDSHAVDSHVSGSDASHSPTSDSQAATPSDAASEASAADMPRETHDARVVSCHLSAAGRQALAARQALAGRSVSVALIDASGHHPWPAAHLLALAPVLAPGAWVILPDVRLPLFDTTTLAGHGPRYLFDSWPGPTRRGGRAGNLGAIRLPDDLSTLPALVAQAVRETWEVLPPHDLCATVGIAPADISSNSRIHGLHLMQQATAAGRPLYLWGAGESGRQLLALLRRHDVRVAGFVDRSLDKQGTSVDNIAVASPALLDPATQPRPYIGVSGVFAGEIAAGLLAAGWSHHHDYAVL